MVQICRHILFVHAFLGRDITSKVFGIGKAAGFKLIQDCKAFWEQVEVFKSKRAIKAGEKAWLLSISGTPATPSMMFDIANSKACHHEK